jgi:hypothetical protein
MFTLLRQDSNFKHEDTSEKGTLSNGPSEVGHHRISLYVCVNTICGSQRLKVSICAGTAKPFISTQPTRFILSGASRSKTQGWERLQEGKGVA